MMCPDMYVCEYNICILYTYMYILCIMLDLLCKYTDY